MSKATFHWQDPFLLDQQLTEDERMVREAAQAYFGKDVRSLTLAESATLAGLIQRPSYTNPVRWPDRAKSRRNIVLTLMREPGLAALDDGDWRRLAAATVRGGLQALGGR